jgi:tetratricopeptide (TPR) repeat protein
MLAGLVAFLTAVFARDNLVAQIFGYTGAAIIMIVSFFFNRHMIFPENLILKRLSQRLIERLESSEQPIPRFLYGFSSAPFKIRYHSLIAQIHVWRERLSDALKEYEKISELPLFEDERRKAELAKAQVFCLAGRMKGAETLLSGIDVEKHPDLMVNRTFVEALVEEQKGNLERAYDLMNSILDIASDDPIVLNNIARLNSMISIRLDMISFYKKALQKSAEGSHHRGIRHTIYRNLIDAYLLDGYRDRALETLRDYRTEFDNNDLLDRLEIISCQIDFGRQTGDRALVIDTIATMFIDVLPRLSEQQKLHMLVSSLRIVKNLSPIVPVMNVRGIKVALPAVHDNITLLTVVLSGVKQNWKKIQTLEFRERFLLNKEVFLILDRMRGSDCTDSFGPMLSSLEEFFASSEVEIQHTIDRIESSFVFERWRWENERLFLMRFLRQEIEQDHLYKQTKKILDDLTELSEILRRNGAILGWIEARLNLLDEELFWLNSSQHDEIRKFHLERMRENLILVSEKVRSIGNHAAFPAIHIRLSYYALAAGNLEMSRKHLQEFKNTRISILHFDSWIRGYYADVENALAAYSGT